MENNQKERIEINGRVLQLGVLSNEEGYQLYLYPGMSVAEIAFSQMVLVRLLMRDDHVKDKEEFDAIVNKYFTDPQYAPLEEGEILKCTICQKVIPKGQARDLHGLIVCKDCKQTELECEVEENAGN